MIGTQLILTQWDLLMLTHTTLAKEIVVIQYIINTLTGHFIRQKFKCLLTISMVYIEWSEKDKLFIELQFSEQKWFVAVAILCQRSQENDK